MSRKKEPIEIETIKENIFKTRWNSLKVHVERNQVLSISPELSLAQIAKLIVDDEQEQIQDFLDKGYILKPSKEVTLEWSNLIDTDFNFIIVSPYVLVQVVVD